MFCLLARVAMCSNQPVLKLGRGCLRPQRIHPWWRETGTNQTHTSEHPKKAERDWYGNQLRIFTIFITIQNSIYNTQFRKMDLRMLTYQPNTDTVGARVAFSQISHWTNRRVKSLKNSIWEVEKLLNCARKRYHHRISAHGLRMSLNERSCAKNQKMKSLTQVSVPTGNAKASKLTTKWPSWAKTHWIGNANNQWACVSNKYPAPSQSTR